MKWIKGSNKLISYTPADEGCKSRLNYGKWVLNAKSFLIEGYYAAKDKLNVHYVSVVPIARY